MWRLIAGKLYMAHQARNFLVAINREPWSHKYEVCPYCHTSRIPSTIEHQLWSCPALATFWSRVKDTFRRLDIHFPITNFNDFITFFALSDSHDLTASFRNNLVFNAIYAIHSEFHELMHKWDDLSASEFQDYLDQREANLIHRYNALNHKSLMSYPHTARDIAFRSHMKGNSDPTKSALQVRYRYLQPHLNVDLTSLSPSMERSFNLTWAKNSVLAKIVSRRIHFLPLPTPPDAPVR